MHATAFARTAFAPFFVAATLIAQSAAPPDHWEIVPVQSGVFANASPVEGVVYRTFVNARPGAPWLRLYFSRIWLDKGSYLRIVSLRDGAVQTMHMHHVEEWSHSSAYFNGDAVLLEIIAGPGTNKNYVEIEKVRVGDHVAVQTPDTICGFNDDRVPSSNPAAGRIDPVGCSGWIINVPATGTQKLHLSAGHCFGGGQVLEFDVPPSASNCGIVHPPPSKQFAIDSASSIAVNSGIGNDYWVYRCFPNSTTGLTTFQTQGAAFSLATALPGAGTPLRNFGYGLDGTDFNGGGSGSCDCPGSGGTRNQVQQTTTGSLNGASPTTLTYAIDTCGGNSGSVVTNDTTGLAVAIHTNGGCNIFGGSNSGTAITNAGLQAAISVLAGGTGGAVPNDECPTPANVVDGPNGAFSNAGATTSLPFPCGNAATGRDVWFRYVATCSGVTTFDTCSATRTFDTVLEVFDGTCGALISLGCNDDSCGLGSSLSPTLVAGATYLVRVGGFGGQQGSFDLTITSCGSANECTGAVPLRQGGNGPFTNAGSSTSLPGWPCGAGANDIWFSYPVPAAANVTFTTCNGSTTFDTVLQVFAGGCGALTPLACNDDDFNCAGGIRRSTVVVAVGGPQQLFVRVGGFGGATGSFGIDVVQTPTNDECQTAIVLGNGVNGPFANLNATTSGGWPCGFGGSDVWFAYTASCNGMLVVDTCSAVRTFDTTLEVFNDACGALGSLVCNDDACSLGSSVAVPVSQGQNYFVRLGGFGGAQGLCELTVRCVVPSDECTTATPLATGVNGPFTNAGATTSTPALPCGLNSGLDLWFSYTAPFTAPVTFWTCTGTRTFDSVLEAFDGSCGALQSLGCNDDFCGTGSRVTVNAVQGTTYFVRVGGYNGQVGAFDVEVQPGTGTGSIGRNVHGCGAVSIQASGQPHIGGAVTTTLGAVAGVPFVGLGFVIAPVPFCSICTFGHEWGAASFGASYTLGIPLNPVFLGLQVGIQGADFVGAGGCASPQIALTDTLVVTIG